MKGRYLAVTWRDTRIVKVLCNVTGYLGDGAVRRRDRKGAQIKISAIELYNSFMGGVNLSNQRVSSYRHHMKSLTWYHCMSDYTYDDPQKASSAPAGKRKHCSHYDVIEELFLSGTSCGTFWSSVLEDFRSDTAKLEFLVFVDDHTLKKLHMLPVADKDQLAAMLRTVMAAIVYILESQYSSMPAIKTKTVDYLDGLEDERRESILKMAVVYGQKQRDRRRKGQKELRSSEDRKGRSRPETWVKYVDVIMIDVLRPLLCTRRREKLGLKFTVKGPSRKFVDDYRALNRVAAFLSSRFLAARSPPSSTSQLLLPSDNQILNKKLQQEKESLTLKGHLGDPILTVEPQLQSNEEFEPSEKQVCPHEDEALFSFGGQG
ncbi:hypothetical protein LSH36_853g00029 [Paralvinella palmiformis]|uniref:Uncharacterized protein n=1 Tax=Paralvinella palmiformis TaxID=53620 RepID=A0AAD9IZA8_9ANNE|nr:hypothetical protein LSH36_853g00029 [Paralvinella palmiformis]